MPLKQFNQLNNDADAQLKQLAALGDFARAFVQRPLLDCSADDEQTKKENQEDAAAEAAAQAEADAQNFWPDEKVTSRAIAAHVQRVSTVGAHAAAEAASALRQLQLSDSSSTPAPPSSRRETVSARSSADSDDDAPPPVPSPSELDWT
jgi:hypothetical protein